MNSKFTLFINVTTIIIYICISYIYFPNFNLLNLFILIFLIINIFYKLSLFFSFTSILLKNILSFSKRWTCNRLRLRSLISWNNNFVSIHRHHHMTKIWCILIWWRKYFYIIILITNFKFLCLSRKCRNILCTIWTYWRFTCRTLCFS